MIEQIKQVPNYQSLTPQEIRDYLDQSVEIVNLRGWTPTTMEKEGGLAGYEVDLLLETLRQSGGRGSSAFTWLSTNPDGLELGSDERQKMIDTLSAGGQWESQIPGMTNRVKALGRSKAKRYQQLGLAELPTTEQIEDALNPDFDTESKEILFTLNRQGDGQTVAFLRITPVKLRDGVVVDRSESQSIFNNELIEQIKSLIEQSV